VKRRQRRRSAWPAWAQTALEATALLAAALIAVLAVLGGLRGWLDGRGPLAQLLAFAGVVLALGCAAAMLLRGWLAARTRLARRLPWSPAAFAGLLSLGTLWFATGPVFRAEIASVHLWLGGSAEAQRQALAHQVYAAYRRSDRDAVLLVLERSRVYEPTVREAAAAFGVDPEVLMGLGAAESAFYPRDSADGGHGLFQITMPPAAAVTEAERRLRVDHLDPLNQRHNAFVAAATLRGYLDEMGGDVFLALLAYNIGPRNGGLRAIMTQYGARDFVTIQPYLQHLPRDYPIRVLSAALAYRLWRRGGLLPPYEEGANARHIQSVGIPGLSAAKS
jgi:soluble lytic murein transglycosylase-like protein